MRLTLVVLLCSSSCTSSPKPHAPDGQAPVSDSSDKSGRFDDMKVWSDRHRKFLAIVRWTPPSTPVDAAALESQIVSYVTSHKLTNGRTRRWSFVLATELWMEIDDVRQTEECRDLAADLVAMARARGQTLFLTCHLAGENHMNAREDTTFDPRYQAQVIGEIAD